jgi:hypothetical protein
MTPSALAGGLDGPALRVRIINYLFNKKPSQERRKTPLKV